MFVAVAINEAARPVADDFIIVVEMSKFSSGTGGGFRRGPGFGQADGLFEADGFGADLWGEGQLAEGSGHRA